MQVDTYMCDNCMKKTENWKERKTWIKIRFEYYSGIETTEYMKGPLDKFVDKNLDFCSPKCVGEWFENFVITSGDV